MRVLRSGSPHNTLAVIIVALRGLMMWITDRRTGYVDVLRLLAEVFSLQYLDTCPRSFQLEYVSFLKNIRRLQTLEFGASLGTFTINEILFIVAYFKSFSDLCEHI